MKNLLVSIALLLPAAASAEDLVFNCTSHTGERFHLTRHEGENTGYVESSIFEGDVLVFPGLGSLTFLNMFGAGESWVVTPERYHFSMSIGTRYDYGMCFRASGDIDAEIDQGVDSEGRTHY